MSLFGQSTTGGGGGSSVFGQPTQNQQQASQTGGGLFGNAQQQDKPATGGLFGGGQQSSGATSGGGFGQPAQQSAAPSIGGGMFGSFGQAKPAAGGDQQSSSSFGQPAQQSAAPSIGGGMFGSFGQAKPTTGGDQQSSGGFGQPAQQSTAPSIGGGMFGSFGQAKQQEQQPTTTGTSGGGIFGQFGQTRPLGTSAGSLFGSQPQAQQTSTLSGTTAAPSLFGGSTMAAATPNNTQQPQQNSGILGGSLWGASMQPAQPQNSQPQQPAGAYFDSLFAKTQKDGGNKTNMEDLPSLELGLGDLRHRLRKLQSKQNEKPLDGKAHYLLAASGVDPSAAAKDLGMLDVQGGRVERSHGYSGPNEIDVETYLSNLQTKTTLDMISDGLERSLRDFDNFLEDNVAMEWDAQRKRIYQHFGIKPREDSAAAAPRESQGGFGRSRRKPHAPAAARTGRNSVLGNSMLQRSVIGTPSRIGTHHQSEFSDVDRSADSDSLKPRGATEDRVLRERQSKLADKVRTLNIARVMKRPYPILAELAEVEQKSHEPHAPHVVEAYRAMIEIVGEDAEAETTINSATAKERQYAGMYLDENPNSSPSIEMRRRILQGSTAFLEKQFLREVESLIAKHPHEAKLGGLPDITSKIKAYIRLRSVRKDLVPDNTELQQVQGEFIWAVVFYLLRSGHVNEAAQYVNDNSNHFRGIDRTFATYLNNYAASQDRRITNRKLLDRCTNEYIQRSRNAPENSIDPFRMASYKVIGRIELSNRNLDGLNTDINDWIWLQFNLAREGDKTLEMAGESYGLAELQSSIYEIGTKHFPKSTSEDTTNGSFGMFFYLQILAGMFEDAIAYLYPFSYVDAVHFALALEYYGLLRPSDPMSASNDLRSYSVKNLPQINFGRMLGYYTRDFRAADVVSAVDYLTLICLNQDLGGEAGQRQSNLCHEALRELVLETREFSKLIGDIRPDGHAIRGIIEERGPLIGLTEETDFVNTVTLQAASFADESGRTTDSVLLYHLAGEYDTVVAIVSRALSEAISLEIGEDPMRLMPVKSRADDQQQQSPDGGSSLSLASIDDPIELAKTMMAMYERDAMFYRKIQDQNKVACRVLLEMSGIKKLVEGGQWAQGLDKIKTLEILPLNAGGEASTIRAYATKFTSLSQPVSINVPNLLLWTIICCVRQREQLTSGHFSGNEGTRRMMVEQLKQMALDLTTYTSQLRYRFPPHLHEALARASAE
ncbi:nuclear pore complex subunit [Claviceps maximensis]|nr:nuclear pore complex subunit [Claviceps maximensis]